MDNNLYLITNGRTKLLMTPTRQLVDELPDADGIESVLVYAPNRRLALALCDLYDKNKIEVDNVMLWTGEIVGALKAD